MPPLITPSTNDFALIYRFSRPKKEYVSAVQQVCLLIRTSFVACFVVTILFILSHQYFNYHINFSIKIWKIIFITLTCSKSRNTNFTDVSIPLKYSEKKIIKTKQNNNDVPFLQMKLPMECILSVKSISKFIGKLWILFIMSITNGITNGKFCHYFPESSGTVHFLIALLITVLYRQNHRRIEKLLVLFGGFLKNFD